MKRIVVKVGSNVLTTDSGKLDITRMSSLVDQIAWLRWHGYEVILVSSGAVACGRRELQVDHHLDSVEQRQLFSAMGQVKLVNLYYDLFREYNIHIGQVLTMKSNFQTPEQYRNQQACMEVMLQNGELDLLSDVSYTPERAKNMLFSTLSMGCEEYYILIDNASTSVDPGDIHSLNGKRIGVNQGSIQQSIFERWAKDNGMTLYDLPCWRIQKRLFIQSSYQSKTK